ncbi:MAG: CDP-diacylglycerol--glycerol-3-phosphate 3-phosphatidyltransferase [Clostridia bacterium]|nr:CDP-diacylglycerol--glycerol-3-phosphate 3-phosphatidyltransferase [Clostridia bacterium]
MNLPNKLTLMRMILVPVVVVFFYLGALAPIFYYLATAMFIIAAITDFFDGYLARKHNLITDFGKFMDPLADKALVLVALILIVDKGLVAELIPVPYTLFTALNLIAPISLIIMLIRELVVSGVRLVGANKGVVIAADKLGKIKTFTQDIALPILLLSYAFVGPLYCVFAYVGIAFLVAASIVSVISGIQYIVKNINLFDEAK